MRIVSLGGPCIALWRLTLRISGRDAGAARRTIAPQGASCCTQRRRLTLCLGTGSTGPKYAWILSKGKMPAGWDLRRPTVSVHADDVAASHRTRSVPSTPNARISKTYPESFSHELDSPVVESRNAIRSSLVGDEPTEAGEFGVSDEGLRHVVVRRE